MNTPVNPQGLHLWYVDLEFFSSQLLITTTKRDPTLAIKKALRILKDRKSEFHGKTFAGIKYGGTLDA